MGNILSVNTDGGSRGNPGPAACGWVVTQNSKVVLKGSKFLGTATNNQAEYFGVIWALDNLIEKGYASEKFEIIFYLDSLLVAMQLSEIYKIKNEDLRNLFFTAKEKEKLFKNTITYRHIPREKNYLADELLNNCLDNNI
jgi:ribonuclease HI